MVNFSINTYSSDFDFANAVTLALRYVMKQNTNVFYAATDISEPRMCRTYTQTPKTEKCGEFSGDSSLDKVTCLARSCCFDQEVWDLNRRSSAGARVKQGLTQTDCAWNNIYNGLYGLPSIQGDSSSCCEKHACYSIGDSLESQWSSWTSWLPCSKSCGGGTRERFRQCKKLDGGSEMSDDQCQGRSVDQTECNMQFCGEKRQNNDLQNNNRQNNLNSLLKTTEKPTTTQPKQNVFEYSAL